MTGDELAAALYVEHGFISMATVEPLHVGEIWLGHAARQAGVPLRVIGRSSSTEYANQARRAGIIAPDLALGEPPQLYPYYYRVEAAD